MATIADVVTQLKENNKEGTTANSNLEQRSADLLIAVKDLNGSIKDGFSQLTSSISKMTVVNKSFLKMPKIPGLESLKNALTDNMFVRAIGNFKDTVLAAVTAPFALIKSAIISVKDTFTKVFKGIGSFLLAPFKLIGNLVGKFTKKKDTELLESIYEKIAALNTNIENYITDKKNQGLDQLEAQKEAAKKDDIKPSPKSKSLLDKMKSGFDAFTMFLSGGLGSTLLAIGASLLGFDSALKAVFMGKEFTKIKNIFTSIGKAFKEMEIFGKLKEFLKFDKLKAFFSGDSIIAKGLRLFGSVFKGVSGLFKTILKPIQWIAKFLRVNPITSIILTVIDGIVGFVKGFMGTEGTLGEKLMGGLEGAFLGIVKGFTEAIDFVAIKIPAWLLEKLGFDDAAKWLESHSLTGLVDGVYTTMKDWITSLPDKITELSDTITKWWDDFIGWAKGKLGKVAKFFGVDIDWGDAKKLKQKPKSKRQQLEEQLKTVEKTIKDPNTNPEVVKKLNAERMKLIAALANTPKDEPKKDQALNLQTPDNSKKEVPVSAARVPMYAGSSDARRKDDPVYKELYAKALKSWKDKPAVARRVADIKYDRLAKKAQLDKAVSASKARSAERLKSGADETADLKAAQTNVSAPVVTTNNVDGRSIQNNTTVMNSSMPSTLDREDTVAKPL